MRGVLVAVLLGALEASLVAVLRTLLLRKQNASFEQRLALLSQGLEVFHHFVDIGLATQGQRSEAALRRHGPVRARLVPSDVLSAVEFHIKELAVFPMCWLYVLVQVSL